MKGHNHTAAPVLPWIRLPISIPTGSGVPLEEVHGLQPTLRQAVTSALGFSELFPVQAAVWRQLAGGLSAAHDMCICAPTGSGKTLAYALPLVNAIAAGRQPHTNSLTGLVVLPTRDLAVQVFSVVSALGQAAGLTVALAAAQQAVGAEAAKLVALPSRPRQGPHLLVATPGRLMAHLHSTSGFTVKGVRFLVVDEADRLLRQDYQGWLPEVLQQIQPKNSSNNIPLPGQQQQQQAMAQTDGGAAALRFCSAVRLPHSSCSGSSSNRLLKLIVSATLTRDPSKLMRLELHNPRYIALTDVQHRYALPQALQQYRVVVPAQHKPLALLGLLHSLAGSTSIVFASSLETTHRLYLMLAAIPGLPDSLAEYSSHIPTDQRAAALEAFKSGTVKVLVTSDAMARGMDVAGVANVINYDPPVYPKTYVHRAGRTARAGQTGSAYTLLKPEDVVHFSNMVSRLKGSVVKQMKLTHQQLQPLRPAIKQALQEVQQLLQQEKQEQLERQRFAGMKAGKQPQKQRQRQQQQQQQLLHNQQKDGIEAVLLSGGDEPARLQDPFDIVLTGTGNPAAKKAKRQK